MPRFELDGDVWQIVQSGKQLELTSGGKASVRTFQTPDQAAIQLGKLVAEKLAAGYQSVQVDPRHLELERAIAADPDAPLNYSVYADWLQSQGDPRGALMALQIGAEGSDPTKLAPLFARELKKHSDYMLGPLAAFVAARDGDHDVFEWRYGFIDRAYLHAERQQPLAKVLGQLLDHPSGRFLGALTLGLCEQDAIELLASRSPLRLRALRLWSVRQLDLHALWPAMSQLRRLTIAGEANALGSFDLPRLERLEIADSEMTDANMRRIARGPFTALQHLRLDFGHGYTTGNASIDDVFAMVHRSDLTSLTRLGLVHTRYIRELVLELAASRVAPQLERIDLSNNQMTDFHALALARDRDKFPRLTHLDVSNNKLGNTGIDALRGAFPNVSAQQQQPG